MKMFPMRVESLLGFDVVRDNLRRYLLSPLGEAALAQARTADTLEEVQTRLGRTAELQHILLQQRGVPMEDFHDVGDTLDRLAPMDAFVPGTELREILQVCRAMRRLRRWFADGTHPLLTQVAKRIVVLRPLEDHMESVIDASGEVRNSASAALLQLRTTLRQRRASLRARLLEVLQEAQRRGYAAEMPLTVRGGRMVIPVRAEAKRKVKGFIHGMSASAQTVFVEPADCLELNNEVRLLEEEERREIVRILRATGARVRSHADVLRSNLDLLGYFDLLQAVAQLAAQLDAVHPRLNRYGLVDIRQGRNPALVLGAQRIVVPLDICLGDDARTMVITGPNAGGKTVAMKTVGLLSLMIAYGMPVPVHPESSLCLFDRIMVEIGDNQSIEEDLSTFSARVAGLSRMVKEAGSGTLILVDEIGTGTDPAEGAALAQAALVHWTGANARTVVTTHHGTLKAFAHEAVGVENGSMEFDQSSLQPTFRFRQGLPGSSYAFLIAERLKLDPAVLAKARRLVGRTRDSLESLLLSVQEQRRALSDQIAAMEGRLVRSRIFRRSPVRALPGGKSSEKRRRKMAKRRPGSGRGARPSAHIVAGARVVLDGGASIGEVIAVEGSRAVVAFGSMRVQVSSDRLDIAPEAGRDRPVVAATPHNASVALDLRGYRVKDAVREVEKLLDDAVRADIRGVQILHGKGTGALREAVHAFLAESGAVKEYSTPQVNPGVTYARLH